LKIYLPISSAWESLSWALDQLEYEIEDKDIKEKSLYIKAVRPSDEGIFTLIFDDEAVKKTFKIYLKDFDKDSTNVFFFDISEENDSETKSFSYELFKNILEKLKK